MLKGDALRELEKMVKSEEKFDIIVIDPPSFAKQKSEVKTALEQYARLATLGVQLVNPGGILMLASCSSRVSSSQFFQEVEYALEDAGKSFTL